VNFTPAGIYSAKQVLTGLLAASGYYLWPAVGINVSVTELDEDTAAAANWDAYMSLVRCMDYLHLLR